jgi:hypothetical protein
MLSSGLLTAQSIDVLAQEYETFLNGLNKNTMTTDYLWNNGFYNTSVLEDWYATKSTVVESEQDWSMQLECIKKSTTTEYFY